MWVTESGGALPNFVEEAFRRQRRMDLYEFRSSLVYKEFWASRVVMLSQNRAKLWGFQRLEAFQKGRYPHISVFEKS